MKRTMGTVVVVLVLAGTWLAGCGGGSGGGADAEVPEEALERARDAANVLTAELKKRLASEMATGGPPAAIHVCAEVAPEIAAAHSVDGVTVRRVSLKVRNPDDRPDAWEGDQLVALEERHAAGDLPEEVWEVVDAAGKRQLRYLRPIPVGPMCLNCHGDPSTMSAEVVEAIRGLYPDDEAVGYQAGELRGAVSVTVVLRRGA